MSCVRPIRRRRLAGLLAACTLLGPAAPAVAGPAPLPSPGADPGAALLTWLRQNDRIGPPAGAERLQAVLRAGEAVYLDGGARSTAARFGAVLLDPAFRPLAGSPAHDNLRYHLAGALERQSALASARGLLLELIRRRPPSHFRAPAFRKLVDLSLRADRIPQTLEALRQLGFEPEPAEADELAYLRGKALVQLGHREQARAALDEVGRSSRLFAAARYLAGLDALAHGERERAEEDFCALVRGGGRRQTTFYLSADAERVVAHAWLALARLRHDRGDHARAIATYDQVAGDARAVERARYEKAWSLYRLDALGRSRHQLRRLLLTAPGLAEAPMARLLLGYALLGDCLFDQAQALFERIEQRQTSLAAAVADPAGTQRLPRQVRAWVPPSRAEARTQRLWAGLAESLGRSRWLRAELARVGSGMPRRQRPRPAAALADRLRRTRSRARGLEQRLADLRARLGRAENEQSKLEALHRLQAEVQQAAARADRALAAVLGGRPPAGPVTAAAGGSVPVGYLKAERAWLDRSIRTLVGLRTRAGRLLVQTAEDRRRRCARRVAGWARRSALGRIDTVTARKQALETEVQNLALGRYPLSLLRELAEAGLLDDQSEYWPYDGELWPDEYE